jgi:RNA polymerase sigma-70 factor (ECF subfamily)
MPPEDFDWFNAEVKPCEPALRAYLQKRFPLLPDHDDLLQETYTRIVVARRAGRVSSAKAYLFTVARNLAIDLLRRRLPAHEPLSDTQEISALGETSDVATVLDRRQRHEALRRAVSVLPDRCRAVMMLRFIEGLPNKDVAERLGISVNTVKVHMARGVKDCIRSFRQEGLFDNRATGALVQESA